MQQLVECVPNFSEGRNTAVYTAIADAIRSVRGVNVLDVSADPDHNRTVVTFVGSPTDVEEAAFRGIAKSAELINLDHHEGEHPRIGATDVCPFIPIRDVTIDDCIAMANRLGERVGAELGMAVYLYGNAAKRPERETLSAIRKGQYELWKSEVETNPDREPDFGPAKAKPWGATVIGVRPFLVAYNLYLNTHKVELADKISRTIRFSSGGLRYVQAKGFLVDGQAQVSMNLTNFEKTSIPQVQEMVRREAARYGLTITKAELVGMIPQKALMESAKYYLQLDDLVMDEQVLEYRLQETETEADSTPYAFLEAVASKKPTPGGGSVAALAGALAASLAQMVAGLTVDRKKYAEVQEQVTAVLDEATSLREKLTLAIAEDAAAFDAVMAAYRNKELSASEREAQVQKATIGAAEVPLRVAQHSHQAAQLAADVAKIGNINAVTDATAGVLLAQAAVETAVLNVKINATSVNNKQLIASWQQDMDKLTQETAVLVQQTKAVAAERGGFA
ncbi:glutamate formimidoyltransferase [Candidatus Leptofilum sp.]|uniref:glutamate formimidoyltransferase n=1 Tax=Candidatus Leptofilum sp. TaxID=3241576 RepID=UPI003B5ACC25